MWDGRRGGRRNRNKFRITIFTTWPDLACFRRVQILRRDVLPRNATIQFDNCYFDDSRSICFIPISNHHAHKLVNNRRLERMEKGRYRSKLSYYFRMDTIFKRAPTRTVRFKMYMAQQMRMTFKLLNVQYGAIFQTCCMYFQFIGSLKTENSTLFSAGRLLIL